MAGYRHTGVGNASARTMYAAAGQVQDGSLCYGTVGGTADVITLTLTPAITAYVAGQKFSFLSSGANTTNVTINVSTVGAKAITKNGTTALAAGDIPSGAICVIEYDGTQFQLINVQYASLGANTFTGLQTFAAGADIASATTVDLTAATGNLVRITGTTETTGVTMNNGQAVLCYPTGAWPLTYHATNMPIKGGVSYTCAAGDTVIFSKDGNGSLHVDIFKADGTALVGAETAWTDYSATSTIVGWSSYTTKQIYYKDIGKTRFVTFVLYGTSNSTSASFTLPSASSNDVQTFVKTRAIDNGVENTSGGMLVLQPNASTVNGYTAAAGAWTASGTKLFAGQFTYQLP